MDTRTYSPPAVQSLTITSMGPVLADEPTILDTPDDPGEDDTSPAPEPEPAAEPADEDVGE